MGCKPLFKVKTLISIDPKTLDAAKVAVNEHRFKNPDAMPKLNVSSLIESVLNNWLNKNATNVVLDRKSRLAIDHAAAQPDPAAVIAWR